MPRDAMLGLLAGVTGVVAIAVVYYQKAAHEPVLPKPNDTRLQSVTNYPTPAATPAAPVR